MECYRDFTYGSRFFLKKWLHRQRYQKALYHLDLRPADTVLDYGCGDGYFLHLCQQQTNTARLFGFEPGAALYAQAVARFCHDRVPIVQNIEDIRGTSFSKIACLDVCEHLDAAQLRLLLSRIAMLLSRDGTALITVPVEVGIPALAKNAFRMLHKSPIYRFTFFQYMKSGLGLPVERDHVGTLGKLPYIYSHKGFDYREFEKMLCVYIHVEARYFAPVAFLGGWLNNTVMYTCTRKKC